MNKYDLRPLIHRDAMLFEVNKCMCGLSQAGLLSKRRLIVHLAAHGYIQDDTSRVCSVTRSAVPCSLWSLTTLP
jgi:hypothetical protein